MSRQEQEELQLIKNNVTVNESSHTVTAKYPLIGDPAKLCDNRWQAEKMIVALECSSALSRVKR